MKTYRSNNVPSIIHALKTSDDDINVLLNKPNHFDKIVSLSKEYEKDGRSRINIITNYVTSKQATFNNRDNLTQNEINVTSRSIENIVNIKVFSVTDVKLKLQSEVFSYSDDNKALIRNEEVFKKNIGMLNDYKYYLAELTYILSCILSGSKCLTIGFQSNYNDHNEITDDRSLNVRYSDNCTMYWDVSSLNLKHDDKDIVTVVYNLPYKADSSIINIFKKSIDNKVVDWFTELPTFAKEYALVKELGMKEVTTLSSLAYIAGDANLSISLCKTHDEVMNWFHDNYKDIAANHLSRNVYKMYADKLSCVEGL